MKLFLRKGLLLFTIICLIVILTSVVNNHYVDLAREEVNLIEKNKRVLVFGDSQVEFSINTMLFPIIENRARSGEPYYYNYLKIKDVLLDKRNNKDNVDCILISYHYFSFNKSIRDSIFVGKDGSNQIPTYRSLHKNRDNSPCNFGIPTDSKFDKVVLVSNLGMINQTTIKNFLLNTVNSKSLTMDNVIKSYTKYKGAFNYHECEFNNNADKTGPHHMRDANDFDRYFRGTKQIDMLTKIAELTSYYNIPLVLITPPCHDSYKSYLYPELKEFNDSIATSLYEKYGVLHLDYFDYEMADSCYRDSNHLNGFGSEVFTPILVDTLKKLSLIN